jgi:hypothetical protein
MNVKLIVIAACWLVCQSHAGAESNVTIESGVAQLLVDDYLIERASNLHRTLCQPVKDDGGNQPVIELADEFGDYTATLEANGTIVFDPRLKKYVMFALGISAQKKGWDRFRLYRFTSDDGMTWTKGDDGKPQCIYPLDRNFFYDPKSGAHATNIDVFSCYYDTQDEAFPYKGWQWFANWEDGREGTYLMRSADGIQWERGLQIMNIDDWHIEQDGFSLYGAGDVTTFINNPRNNNFLALIKFANKKSIGPGNRQRSRSYLFVDSISTRVDPQRLQHVDLVPRAEQTGGDFPHDEYYASTAWRYGSMWLGTLKIWHGGGDHRWSAAGCAYLKLVSSRDGLHWNKVRFDNDAGDPEVFVANGPEGGNDGRNDGGYVTEFSNPPLRIGDELIFYYGASSWGKNHPPGVRVTGGGVFRARLRPDGFVAVDRGQVTTKPLKLEGDRLLANSVGTINVALLDADNHRLATTTVEGDSLEHPVRFGGKEIGDFKGPGGIRLQFEVEPGSKLYAFTVK